MSTENILYAIIPGHEEGSLSLVVWETGHSARLNLSREMVIQLIGKLAVASLPPEETGNTFFTRGADVQKDGVHLGKPTEYVCSLDAEVEPGLSA